MTIFDDLRAAANPEKAATMSGYMRNQFAFLGIPKPLRKEISQEFLKGLNKRAVDWDFVFECWEQPEREFQYLAMDYLSKLKNVMTPEDIPNLHTLIVTKSWWDTVDMIDVYVGDIALRYPQVNDILLEWSEDRNMWLRRTAIDHQLGRKEQTDTELLEQIIVNNFGKSEFFITKAIGWSLREYSKTDPAWVRRFIRKYRDIMSALSVREARKYL